MLAKWVLTITCLFDPSLFILCVDVYISTNCDPHYFLLYGDLHKGTL